MIYNSQLGQDKFINEYFNGAEGLVFLDLGAHDGVTGSNTYSLEKYKNWKGICVEAQPVQFDNLIKNRQTICVHAAVMDFEGEVNFSYVEGYANMLSSITDEMDKRHHERILKEIKRNGGALHNIKVPAKKVQTILDTYSLYEIDFCSIDTEGSELSVLRSIDFTRTKIKVFIIENNYGTKQIQEFLSTKGYYLHCQLQFDDVFIRL